MGEPDLFSRNAHPRPDVKVVHATVIDVYDRLAGSSYRLVKVLPVRQDIRGTMGVEWHRSHVWVRLCIAFRSSLNGSSSAGTCIAIGSLSESGLPSRIVSFFLFHTSELNSVIF